MFPEQKELVEELKIEWKKLWHDRVDDKVRAEGIAIDDYSSLFIDKGTVIHATRDFKAINFKDILEQHRIKESERYIPPNPQVGGWTKFVRENIIRKSQREKCPNLLVKERKENQQLKKCGRGWVHI